MGCLPFERTDFNNEGFKYLLFGHFTKASTSDIERSDQYKRYGEKGHMAKKCNKNSKYNRNIAKSDKREEFRKALTAM